jgi:hypothetical protein
MSKIEWEKPIGSILDRAVLYLDSTAVPWNGLAYIEEIPTRDVKNDYYMEPRRVRLSCIEGDHRLKISALTYPDKFINCCGYAAWRPYRRFGLSYRSYEDGKKTHLIYGCKVEDDLSDNRMFRWALSAPKIHIPGAQPSASLVLERVPEALEDALYGTDSTDPYLPSPTEVIALCLK